MFGYWQFSTTVDIIVEWLVFPRFAFSCKWHQKLFPNSIQTYWQICLLQCWSIPSQTTSLALDVVNPKRWEIFEITGSHYNFKRNLALFSSIWPNPGNNSNLLNFDTKCALMAIWEKHSFSCSSKNNL